MTGHMPATRCPASARSAKHRAKSGHGLRDVPSRAVPPWASRRHGRDGGQQQAAVRVHKGVPLARACPRLPALWRHSRTLAASCRARPRRSRVHDGSCRRRIAAGPFAVGHGKGMRHALKRAGACQAQEPAMHGEGWRELVRQVWPRVSGPKHMQDGVHCEPQQPLMRPARGRRRRQGSTWAASETSNTPETHTAGAAQLRTTYPVSLKNQFYSTTKQEQLT